MWKTSNQIQTLQKQIYNTMWKHNPENQKSVQQVGNKIETGAVQAKYDWHIYNMEVTHQQQQAANKGETRRELQQWRDKEHKNKQYPPF